MKKTDASNADEFKIRLRPKKEREMLLLKCFLESLNVTPDSIKENETPDFDLLIEGKKISVEMTDLIDPVVKQVEAYRMRIIEAARSLFLKRNGNIVSAKFTFLNVSLRGGAENEELYAQALCNAVDNYSRKSFEDSFHDTINFEEHKLEFIDRIYLATDQGHFYWEDFGSHRIPSVNENWLKEKIERKEKMLKKYYDKYDSRWLILVGRLGKRSSALNFDFLYEFYNSSFDKVYVLKYLDKEVIMLK